MLKIQIILLSLFIFCVNIYTRNAFIYRTLALIGQSIAYTEPIVVPDSVYKCFNKYANMNDSAIEQFRQDALIYFSIRFGIPSNDAIFISDNITIIPGLDVIPSGTRKGYSFPNRQESI